MLKLAVGHSNDPDSQFAVAEVVEQIRTALGGSSPKAGLLFAAIDFDHPLVLDQIVAAFPEIELIGGTTDGEMSSVLGFEQDSLTLIVFCSDQITITAGLGRGVSKDPVAATAAAIEQAKLHHQEPIQFCIAVPEGLTASGALILDSLNQALGGQVPIFGGLTADQWRFKQTQQFFHTEVCGDAVPVLLFSGPILFSHGVASGWHPIGTPGQVTKADKNVVYEIDDQPALAFYQRYLGAITPAAEYPLAVFAADSDRYYMRAPIDYDPSLGSIVFVGDIPKHARVQITETTHDDILLAAHQSAQQAVENYPGQHPLAALFFSCAGRRKILGRRTQEEYEQAQRCFIQALPQPLPENLVSCGFYTSGEIAPLQPGGDTHLHNETFITLLLGDA
jgi:hypothetical protein